MASVLNLKLQGVRAFDHHTAQTLEFNAPLTLICGQNGVGKTTIIEALSYATTGTMPPNAKGGAFVHDPSMASEKSVLAQVKLRYTNSKGGRMVVTRSVRLDTSAGAKRTTQSLRTVVNQLKIEDALGELASVTSRAGDLTEQVTLSLGVSVPILNYVVFCHQEDSLWPLSEPSVVKKRFDEIFEATKYSKALESLKTIRKEYVESIRVDKVNVEHLKNDRERVNEKKQLVARLSTRIASLNEECTHMQELRRVKTAELNNAVALGQKFQELEYEMKDVQRTAARLAQDAELLRSDTEVLSDPSPALEKELAEWDTRAGQLDTTLAELRARRAQLDTDTDSLRQNLAALSNQQGRIEQALEAREHTLRKRDNLAGDDPPEQHSRNLEAHRAELDDKVSQAEILHRQRESELSQSISAHEAKVLVLRQTALDRRAAVRRADAKVADLQKQIDEYEQQHLEADVQYLKSTLAELEQQVKSSRQSRDDSVLDGELETVQSRINEQERQARRARMRLQTAIEVSSVQSRLVFLRDSLREAEAKGHESLEQIRSVLKIPEATNEDAEATIADARDRSLKCDDERTRADAALVARRTTMNETRSKVESIRAELEAISQSLTVDPAEYESVLREATSDVEVTTENREQAAFAHRFFAEAIAKAKADTPICLLCDHHQSRSEAEAFVARLVARIEALPMSPEVADQEAESARSHADAVQAQGPQVQRWRQFKAELQDLEVTLANAETEVEVLASNQSQLEEAARTARNVNEQLVASLSRPMSKYSRSCEDARGIQSKIDTERAIVSDSETETPQQAQAALNEAESAVRESRAELETLREQEQQRSQRLQVLEQRLSNLKLRISEYDLATARRQQAEKAQSEARSEAAEARRELEEGEAALPDAEAAVADSQARLRSMKHEFAAVESDLAQQRNAIVDAIREFRALESELAAFETQHGPDPLRRIEAERSAAEAEKEKIERAQDDLGKEVARHERMQADLGSHQRRLRDNLRLRAIEHELATTREKKEEVEARLCEAQAHLGDYEQEVAVLQEAVADANAGIATKTGEAKALGEQVRQVRHELATIYKGTEEEYQRAEAQLQSNQEAAEDLVTYVHALDEAIMSFHSIKMAQINSRLDDLWRRTYAGTDIDTILIRSESEAGKMSSTRASYNYRVCMVKQETELDMRGRCSAGQKVLACILIRMALAECFGNSLGLIVLDEPTTNLDHENIVRLAESLGDIIAYRQAERNFQLIVITHDEHFLSQMSPARYCNWYFRIERDERQLSVIKRLPIGTLN